MAGTSGLFGTGLSGLLAARTGLSTAGHNIANVDTPGYTRQRVELAARNTAGGGVGFIGAGVEITSVRRLYDGFLTGQLRTATSSLNELDTYHTLAAQVDNLLGDESGGLSPAVQTFFAAIHDVADDPASIPARQVALSESDALVRRFQTLDLRLDQHREAVTGRLAQIIGDINSYATSIADINRRIVSAEAGAGGPANDLRDERDELVRSLAGEVGISVFAQDDGSLNVTTGTGQVLVVGATAGTLGLTPSPFDPARPEVVFTTTGGQSGIISDVVSGGELAGLLKFRNEVLDPAQNALGRIAVAVSHAVNVQHQLGMDLNGAAGGNVFTDLDTSAGRGFAHSSNTGNASLAMEVLDTEALSTSDYRLERNGATYTLTRLSDSTQTVLAGFPTTPAVVDGLAIRVGSGTIADGDRYLLQPTRFAASSIGMAISAVGDLAAALPVRATAALANTGSVVVDSLKVNSPESRFEVRFTAPGTYDVVDTDDGVTLATGVTYGVSGATHTYNGASFVLSGVPAAGDVFVLDHGTGVAAAANTGSGTVSNVTLAARDPNLTDTVTITFDNPPTTFAVAGATTGAPTTGIGYTSGQPISFNGWMLTLSGTPGAGDTFTIAPNSAGVGDNRNALALADLQLGGSLEGGAASFEDAYGQEITRIGVLTRQAGINTDAQQAVHDQVKQARETVSGVNLDEEAADLLKYQRAYQAAAQMLAVANQTFETLIQAMSR